MDFNKNKRKRLRAPKRKGDLGKYALAQRKIQHTEKQHIKNNTTIIH